MLKNDKRELYDLVKKQAKGESEILCELEKVMLTEAKHIVKNHYDKDEGDEQLWLLLKKGKMHG